MGICLVNNSGLVFAARFANLRQLAITPHISAGTSRSMLSSKHDMLVAKEGRIGCSY